MPLEIHRDASLSLPDLSRAADALLRRFHVQVDDARVSQTTDPRTVRYYQTRGLIDRPLRYDGRRAVYGYRHLLQLLAIKGLQEEGQPLNLIKAALAGRTSEELEGAIMTAVADPAPSPAGGPAPAPAPSRSLIAAEVAPGITVTIDPLRVPDAPAMVHRIWRAVSGAS